MAIGKDYLLKKPSSPSAPKLFLDVKIVPWAVNLAGGVEVTIDRAARRLRVRPAAILAGALGLASIALVFSMRRRRTKTARRGLSQPH